jgi:hypothetical protein
MLPQRLGSGILQYLAGTATVAATVPDYLVLGSFLTTNYAPTLTLFANSLYAATSDPKFAGSGLPSGYITTIPGTRDELFLYASGLETAIPAYEESVKSLATTAERASIGAARNPAVLQAIKVPVIMVVGQFDALFCDEASGLTCATAAAVKTREGPNFAARACFSTYVVQNAGHAYGLHIKGRDAYNATNNWVDNYTFAAAKDANGCVVSV